MKNWAACYKFADPVVGKDFYGRKDILESFFGPDKNNLYVIGIGRMGKSSVLRQIKHKIENEGKDAQESLVVYLDFERATGTPEEILEELTGQVKNGSDVLERLSISHPFRDFVPLIAKLAKTAKDKKMRVALLCDEIGQLTETGDVGQNICNALVNNLKDNEYFRVVATSGPFAIYPDVPKYFGNLTKSFKTLYLKGLDEDDALRLCYLKETENVPLPEKIAKRIVKITGGYPCFIQKLCSEYFVKKESLDEAKRSLIRGVAENVGLSDIGELSDDDKQVLYLLAAKRLSVRRLSSKTGRPLEDIRFSLTAHQNLGLVKKVWWNFRITNEFLKIWLHRRPAEVVIRRLIRSRFIAWLLLAIIAPGLLYLWLNKVIPPELNWLNPRLAIACVLLMCSIIIFNLLDRLPNKLIAAIVGSLPPAGLLTVIISAIIKFFSP